MKHKAFDEEVQTRLSTSIDKYLTRNLRYIDPVSIQHFSILMVLSTWTVFLEKPGPIS